MDLAELGIVFVSEGADAAISKMEKFRDVSVEVTQTDEERIKAVAKVASATNSLSESITRSIVAYSGSKAAQYEFQAILLGSNDALAAQIAQLRELETMDKLATQTARELSAESKAEQAALLDLAKDIQYLNKVKAQEAADSEARRKQELASRDAYYKEIVAKAKAAEQAVTDARHKSILDAQDATAKAAAMYIKDEQERVKAAERTAKEVAATNRKASDDAIKAAEQKTLAEINWAKKSRDEQIRLKQEVAAYRAAGISDKTIGNMVGSGALNGTIKEVDSLADKWNHVTLNTSRARSEMIVLAHEAVQGRFSRIPASMMVFAEYTDISALALSGMGIALIATTAAAVGLGVAMVKGLLEQRELQNALIMTGNYAGTTEGSLNLLAHTATAMGGSIGTAKEVILQLAASGKFTSEQIDAIVPAIVHMEDATGGGSEAVAKLVGEFKSLAVEANAHSRYSDEVSKAILKLDNEYHFLTASVFAQIRALEAEGQTKQASILATNEFAKVTGDRSKEIYNNLGTIERGWRHIKEAIGEAWSAMKDWGKTDTLQGKLMAAAKEIEELADPTIRIGYQTINLGTEHRAKLRAEAIEKYNKIVVEYLENEKKVNKESENSRTQNAANHAISEVTLSDQQMKADKLGLLATKQAEYNNQLERMRAGLAVDKAAGKDTTALEGLLTDDAIAKHRAGLDKLYGEKSKATKEYSTKAMDQRIAEYNLEYQSAAKHTDKMIAESQRKYAAILQIENDSFTAAKSKAASENELGLAPVELYIGYYEKVKQAAADAGNEQRQQYVNQAIAATENANKVLLELEHQVVAAKKGEEDRAAAILQTRAKLKAELEKLGDKVSATDAQEARAAEVAEAEMLKQLSVSRDKAIKQLEDKIAKEEKQIQLLTLGEEGVARLAAKEDEAFGKRLENALKELEADKALAKGDDEKVKFYDLEIEKLKKIIGLKQKDKTTSTTLANTIKVTEEVKAMEAEWKKGWEATNKLGMDVFVAWGEGGEDMAKKIGNMLKRALLEAIYAATLKPIVFDIYTSVMGGGGSTGQQVLNGMGGNGGNGGNGGAGPSWFTNFTGASLKTIERAGEFLINSGSETLNKFGSTLLNNSSQIARFANGAGQFLGYLNAIDLWSKGQRGAGLGTAIGTYFGPIGSMIGNFIGSKFDYKIEPKGSAIVANVGANGASSVANRTDFTQRGGWLGGGTTTNSEWAVADAGTSRYINDAVKMITAGNKAYAESLGMTTEAIDKFTAQITVNTTGMDAAAAQAAIDAELLKFSGQQAAAVFGDSVKQFAREGENTAQTVARISSNLTTVNSTFETLGFTMFDLSVSGAVAASGIVDLLGGLEQFNALTGEYFRNFYSGEEQRNAQAEFIRKTLSEAGIEVSVGQILGATREQFRQLVELYQNDMTPAGREAFAALMRVNGAFAALTPTMEAASTAANEAAQRAAEAAARESQQAAEAAAAEAKRQADAYAAAFKAAQDYIANISNNIKNFLAGLDAQAEGLQSYTKLAAAFSTQMVLARGGDRNALDNITGTAGSLIDVIKRDAASQVEANLRIGRVRAQLSALPAQLSPEQFIVNGLSTAITTSTTTTGTTITTAAASIVSGYNAAIDGLIGALDTGFALIDGDGSGAITLAEMQTALAGKASDSELSRLFDLIDVDNNGILSKLETANAQTNTFGAQVKAALSADFTKLDTSVNNALDFSEFSAGLNGLASDSELRRIFNELDTNGDGVISRLESISANTSTLQSGLFNPNDPIRSVFDAIRADTLTNGWMLQAIANNTSGAQYYLGASFRGDGSLMIRGATTAFAKGGVFTDSVVSSPTLFNMGLMGEAGPEAIMPLTRTSGGELGVRMIVPKMSLSSSGNANQNVNAALEILVTQLTNEVANLRAETRAIVTNTHNSAKDINDFRFRGMLVRTDSDTPLQVEPVT